VVSAKTPNPRGFRYGAYRVWGDLRKSRYFGVEGQPDISGLVRELVEAKAEVLGRSFQGNAAVRTLREAGHLQLLAYAEALPLEPRARLSLKDRAIGSATANEHRVLVSSKEVQGADVYGMGNKGIGEIDHLLI
jgi:hypothetical protein